MDIKDWILIGGGALLLAVVAHGFWLALRNRNGTLRMSIDQNLPRGEFDELDLLRSELPNGGARVRSGKMDSLERENTDSATLESDASQDATDVLMTPVIPSRDKVRTQAGNKSASPAGVLSDGEQSSFDLEGEAIVAEPRHESKKSDGLFGSRKRAEPLEKANKAPNVEELIVINVFGLNSNLFEGSDLVEMFMRNGMKYGFMSIFHRLEPMTKSVQFSVASAMEPGCFELSDIDTYQTPGVSFFLQLPGPQNAIESFEDMLAVAQHTATTLGGDLRDESMSVMTAQTIEHCRLRIHDYTRKRMSQQA
jgi:cell division protein ZipA